MRHYRIYSLDDQGRISFAHETQCPDDLAALSEGEKLSDHGAVEVWEGSRLVARVKAENAPLNSKDHQCL
jgi:hypothetical protein